MKATPKVLHRFRLKPPIDRALRQEARKQKKTMTALVELALSKLLKLS